MSTWTNHCYCMLPDRVLPWSLLLDRMDSLAEVAVSIHFLSETRSLTFCCIGLDPMSNFHSTSCQIDVTVYPYDTQTCTITFASENYHSPKMNFISKNEYMRTYLYHEHGIWSLLNTSACVHTIEVRNNKIIEFKMTLKQTNTKMASGRKSWVNRPI
jgi:hypothetical protein